MQGRLLPKINNMYQSFPGKEWHKEFILAKELGLNCIEFIVDDFSINNNPLLSKSGMKKIKEISKKTGIQVKSICADYFMDYPIHTHDHENNSKSIKILKKIIHSANELRATDVVLPCIEKSSIRIDKYNSLFIRNIELILPTAEKYKINIALESDLNPEQKLNILNKIDSDRLTVNYDIGNSASNGFNVDEEFSAYGNKITDIHIKDRTFNGGPVELGKGDADFNKYFDSLKRYEINPNIYVFQAFRDEQGVDIFKKQYKWYFDTYNKHINELNEQNWS